MSNTLTLYTYLECRERKSSTPHVPNALDPILTQLNISPHLVSPHLPGPRDQPPTWDNRLLIAVVHGTQLLASSAHSRYV